MSRATSSAVAGPRASRSNTPMRTPAIVTRDIGMPNIAWPSGTGARFIRIAKPLERVVGQQAGPHGGSDHARRRARHRPSRAASRGRRACGRQRSSRRALRGVHQHGLADHVDPPRLGGDERRPRHDLGERAERRPRDRDRAPPERAGDVADGDRRIARRGCRCPARPGRPRPRGSRSRRRRGARAGTACRCRAARARSAGAASSARHSFRTRGPRIVWPVKPSISVGASRPATMQGRNT